MFVLLPWKVDVPRDRWPAANWLIIVAAVAVYALRVADFLEYAARRHAQEPAVQRQGPDAPAPPGEPAEPNAPGRRVPPGITGALMLQGWSLKKLSQNTINR